MFPQDLDDLIAENSYRNIFGEPIKGRYREVKEEHGFKEVKEEQYRNEAKTQVKTKINEEKEEDATKVMLNGTLAENTRAQKNESAETGQDIKIDPPQEFPQINIKLENEEDEEISESDEYEEIVESDEYEDIVESENHDDIVELEDAQEQTENDAIADSAA